MTTDVVTSTTDEAVEAATRRLLDRGVDGAPVVDREGRVVGLLGSEDLLVEMPLHQPTVLPLLGADLGLPSSHRAFEAEPRRAVDAVVGDVMQEEPVVCGSDDAVERAATLVHEHDVSRLPVVTDGQIVGIIARGDVLLAMTSSPGR